VRKVPALTEALRGRFTDHYAFLLGQLLTHTDQLADLIAACAARIAALITAEEETVRRLKTIPDVGRRSEGSAHDCRVMPSRGHAKIHSKSVDSGDRES